MCRCVVVTCLLLGFALRPLAAQPAKPDEAIVAQPTYSLADSLHYLAEDKGFFAAQGIRVKTVEIAGLGAINAVISGSADFALPSGASLTRAASRGQRLLAIALLIDRPIVQIVLRNEIAAAAGFDAKAPLDQRALALKGRTIAVETINSVVHGYVRLVAKRGGYDPEAIHIAVMQPNAMIAAFATGQIDGFAMSPPWPQKPVIEGNAVMIASGPDGDPADLAPLANTILVTKQTTCDQRPTLCLKLGHAYAAAAAFLHAHPDEALGLLQKRFANLDDKLIAAAFAVIAKITPDPPAITQAGIENADIFNIEAGLMPANEKLGSYDGLFTDIYVK